MMLMMMSLCGLLLHSPITLLDQPLVGRIAYSHVVRGRGRISGRVWPVVGGRRGAGVGGEDRGTRGRPVLHEGARLIAIPAVAVLGAAPGGVGDGATARVVRLAGG